MPSTGEPRPKRLSMLIPEAGDEILLRLEEQHRVTRTEAVMRSLRLAGYVDDALERGGRVLVEDADGNQTEVVFL